jgi:hypothetical protein
MRCIDRMPCRYRSTSRRHEAAKAAEQMAEDRRHPSAQIAGFLDGVRRGNLSVRVRDPLVGTFTSATLINPLKQ